MTPAAPPAEITVTEAHIANGRPGQACDCPVALAIEAVSAPYSVASVFGEHIWVRCGRWQWKAPTPRAVQLFIGAFDVGARVSPFTFTAEWKQGQP